MDNLQQKFAILEKELSLARLQLIIREMQNREEREAVKKLNQDIERILNRSKSG